MLSFLAQQAPRLSVSDYVMTFPFWIWIAFGGMLMSTIFGVAQMIIKHRERIELIRQGHIPPPDDEE